MIQLRCGCEKGGPFLSQKLSHSRRMCAHRAVVFFFFAQKHLWNVQERFGPTIQTAQQTKEWTNESISCDQIRIFPQIGLSWCGLQYKRIPYACFDRFLFQKYACTHSLNSRAVDKRICRNGPIAIPCRSYQMKRNARGRNIHVCASVSACCMWTHSLTQMHALAHSHRNTFQSAWKTLLSLT